MGRAQKLESHSWLQNLCNLRNLCALLMPQKAANLLTHRVCRFKRNEESPASTLPAGLFTHFGSRLDSELKTTLHHEP